MSNENPLLQDVNILPLNDMNILPYWGKFREFDRFFEDAILDLFNGKIVGSPGREPGIFVTPGILIIEQEAGKRLNIDDKTIMVEQEAGITRYIANEYGYLCVDIHDILTVKSCLVASKDKMKLVFFMLPVQCGKKEFWDHLKLRLEEYDQLFNEIFTSNGFLEKTFRDNYIQTITLKEGLPPVPGVDACLTINKSPEKELKKLKEEGKTFFGKTPFVEVKEGETLAELVCKKKGKNGKDVYDTVIPAAPVKDIIFTYGENVQAVESEDGSFIYYKAKIGGLLELHNSRVNVIPVIDILGDLGPETGDVDFSRSVSVRGDIKSGFKVICGGDLTIEGGVEEGCEIECGGSLSVKGGIFGKETIIKCKGDVSINFAENAQFNVLGNLYVKKYLYFTQVFCKSTIKVEGQNMKGSRHTAVMGGVVCAMMGMDLHSAGTDHNVTRIILGKNENLLEAVNKINHLLPVLDQKIVRLSMRLDATALKKYGSVGAIKGRAEKEHILSILKETKKLYEQKKQLTFKRDQIFKNVYAENPDKLKLKVSGDLVPEISLVVMMKTVKIKSYMKNKTFSYENCIIVHD